MEYRTLGQTGVQVSPLALGTANFGDPCSESESRAILAHAMEAGINFIDTADSYGDGESERFIGRALAESGRRADVLLATKGGWRVGPGPNDFGNTRLHITRACEESLRRLKTEYIDLYYVHRPSFDIPVDETLSALTDLVRQGKVIYIGCSTHPAWKIMQALMISEMKGYARYVAEQPPYNLLDRRIENELVPLCGAYGVAILPWSPTAMGILAGRYADASNYPASSRAALRGGMYADRVTPSGIEVGKRFLKLADACGIPAAQLALLWTKDQTGITAPLIGARTVNQLQEALPVLDMHLTPDIRQACDELVPPGSAVANFHNSADWMKMTVSA